MIMKVYAVMKGLIRIPIEIGIIAGLPSGWATLKF